MKPLRTILSLSLLLLAATGYAQKENKQIATGNKLYKEGKFQEALQAYEQALKENPSNAVARYNLAAARFRLNQFEEALKDYQASEAQTNNEQLKSNAVYNGGVSLTKQKKLLESIEAYKQALRLNPSDADTRFNLQKALEELRKQNKSREPEKKQDKQQQQKDKKKEPRQQPPASKKQIEQWLQSLRQKEQEVQQKMQQQKRKSTSQPEKDW